MYMAIKKDWSRNWQLHALIWPGLVLLILFKFIPMGGIVMAFKDYVPKKGIIGSEWVGMENFSYMFSLPNTYQVLWNTLRIAIEKIIVNFPIPILVALMLNEIQNIRLKKTVQTVIYLYQVLWNTLRIAIEKIIVNFPIPILVALMLNEIQNIRLKKTVQTVIYLPYFISNTLRIAIEKIIVNFPIPILVALMLNEIQNIRLKKTVQTVIYLPYFISWVIIAGIVQDLFVEDGLVNQMITGLGLSPVFFMGEGKAFEGMLIGTDVWKNFGYGTVVYLAAITGVDEALFEAAKIDGASRIKQIWYITIPSIAPIVMLMLILSLGNVMNAGFEQIFNLYNPLVYDSADIIDTFVYRISLVEANYSLGTAVGLLKSVASFILIVSSYGIANKYTDYTVF